MSTGALAVILARGGSKGVPGKNLASVGGRPCIAWTIDQALGSRLVSRIAVSSDDPRTLDIAERAGVLTIHRPAELASDTARVDDAARHGVEECLGDPGGAVHGSRARLDAQREPAVVILYANVPVRPPGLIDRALEHLMSSGADSVQSYQPVGKYHPWWTARLEESGLVRPWEGDVLNHNVFRRQDLPPAYVPDGGVIVCTWRALFLRIPGVPGGPHAFFGHKRGGIVNPEGSVIDIDTPLDLVVANALLTRAG